MDEKIWSRQYTMALDAHGWIGGRDRDSVAASSHVQSIRTQALQRAERAIEKLEQAKGQRAIERLYETRFVSRKGKPCLTVVVTFVMIGPEK